MKRIILFRFHSNVAVCRQRLQLLAALNPGVPIYGIYGGDRREYPRIQRALRKQLTHCFCIPAIPRPALMRMPLRDMHLHADDRDGYWKWSHGDLTMRMWYRAVGKNVPFDVAYLTEWDLLFFQPIEQLYRHVRRDCLGLTGLQPVKVVGIRWAVTTCEPLRSDYEALMRYARERHGYHRQDPLCCFGPGCCFPKTFLEAFSRIHVPDSSIDEVRIPLFAQILGFRMQGTRLCPTWYDMDDFKLFNTNQVNVPLDALRRELATPGGRRVFHPFTQRLPQDILSLYC
ncbi:MAG: Uncharacterized protein Greene041619_1170 [Candidatus Peregrinibacteria bacterium Greene0416_19]|nr:MAG: Uncharacterized protein Greene041619_1170 [Candidatus Peregrinibacteria bacterium Greene0416_19]